MGVEFKVVIPARYASTRLPGKPLVPILGKPMIQWVYQAAQSSEADEVIVATDDQRIIDAVSKFGGTSCLTRDDHSTGTDRIVEVTGRMGWADDTIIVNLQGDEPLMPAQNLTQVAVNLERSGLHMATLHKPIDAHHAQDPNLVKLVTADDGRALYFSRSPIPYQRDAFAADYYGHVGLYAYRVGFLRTFAGLSPCMLEQSEKLEQLRALCHGYHIHTEQVAAMPGPGVDTQRDLEQVTDLLARSTS